MLPRGPRRLADGAFAKRLRPDEISADEASVAPLQQARTTQRPGGARRERPPATDSLSSVAPSTAGGSVGSQLSGVCSSNGTAPPSLVALTAPPLPPLGKINPNRGASASSCSSSSSSASEEATDDEAANEEVHAEQRAGLLETLRAQLLQTKTSADATTGLGAKKAGAGVPLPPPPPPRSNNADVYGFPAGELTQVHAGLLAPLPAVAAIAAELAAAEASSDDPSLLPAEGSAPSEETARATNDARRRGGGGGATRESPLTVDTITQSSSERVGSSSSSGNPAATATAAPTAAPAVSVSVSLSGNDRASPSVRPPRLSSSGTVPSNASAVSGREATSSSTRGGPPATTAHYQPVTAADLRAAHLSAHRRLQRLPPHLVRAHLAMAHCGVPMGIRPFATIATYAATAAMADLAEDFAAFRKSEGY